MFKAFLTVFLLPHHMVPEIREKIREPCKIQLCTIQMCNYDQRKGDFANGSW